MSEAEAVGHGSEKSCNSEAAAKEGGQGKQEGEGAPD